MEKSLERRVWLKVNFSVLRELECKMTLCDRNVLESVTLLTADLMFHILWKLLTNWNLSVSSIMSLSGSQWVNLS